MKVSEHIQENEMYLRRECEKCDDVIIRHMKLGKHQQTDCVIAFVEITVSNMMLADSVAGKFINDCRTLPEEEMRSFVEKRPEPASPTQLLTAPWKKRWPLCCPATLSFSWTGLTGL